MSDDKLSTLARLRWQCRRGMLELDLLLITFLDKSFQSLSLQQREDFNTLLMQSDFILYTWLIKRDAVSNQSLNDIVERILSAAKSSD